MIKKQNRLKSGREVSRILSRGQFVKSQNLSCRYLSQKNDEPTRITVVVSKKIFNKAHDRNRLKRRVREAFAKALVSSRGALIVAFPKRSALEIPFACLQEEVSICLENGVSRNLTN